MYFRSYTLWKSSSDHSVKRTVWEHAFNMWKWPEYLRNLHESPFIVFFHHSERSWFGKCLHLFYLKSYGCLLTHWLPMASILFKIVRICNSQFKCNYLKNEKLFQIFLFHFWNIRQILNIWKKRMIVIGNVFAKLETVKIFLTPLSKKRCFRTRFDSQHVKASQILAKAQWEHLGAAFSSLFWKLIWKMSPLVLGEILGVFLNTLTANGKYPVQYCENLQLPSQVQLSDNWKNFLNFFCYFWNQHNILNILKKNMMVIDNVSPKLQTVKNFVRPLFKKRRFGTRFDGQHVKVSRILAKSPWEHFYHVFCHSKRSSFGKCLP